MTAGNLTYGGTATCTFINEQGQTETYTCTGTGYVNYQDAQTNLKAKVVAELNNRKGWNIQGTISFEIKIGN